MIKLSNETLDIINRIVDVGKSFNIDVFIIDKKGVRAKSDASYIFLAKSMELDDLEVDAICVNKISELNSRLNLVTSVSGKFQMSIPEVKELDGGDTIAQKLKIDGKNVTMEVSCANPALYRLPWAINQEPFVHFSISNNSYEILNGFSRTVQNKNKVININGLEGNILACSEDNERDKAYHVLDTNPKFESQQKDFNFKYNVSNITSMLRGRGTLTFGITDRGAMTTEIDGIGIIIMPERIEGN